MFITRLYKLNKGIKLKVKYKKYYDDLRLKKNVSKIYMNDIKPPNSRPRKTINFRFGACLDSGEIAFWSICAVLTLLTFTLIASSD